MKKISVLLMALLVSFVLFSCKSTESGVVIQGEATQEAVNTALDAIYDAYRNNLDIDGAQEHTVVSNDNLSSITRRYYGSLTDVGTAGPNNGFYFPVIMLASDSHIVDPDLIEPGMKLVIPDLKKNLANPVCRAAIKSCLNDVAYVYNRKAASATNAEAVRIATDTENGLKALAASL